MGSMLSTCPPDDHLDCCTLGVRQLHGPSQCTGRARPGPLWGHWQLQDRKDVHWHLPPSCRPGQHSWAVCCLNSRRMQDGASPYLSCRRCLNQGGNLIGDALHMRCSNGCQSGLAYFGGWWPAETMVSCNVVTCSQGQVSTLCTKPRLEGCSTGATGHCINGSTAPVGSKQESPRRLLGLGSSSVQQPLPIWQSILPSVGSQHCLGLLQLPLPSGSLIIAAAGVC